MFKRCPIHLPITANFMMYQRWPHGFVFPTLDDLMIYYYRPERWSLSCSFFLQESYAMLHKYELSVAKEEADKVDTLRYAWEKLLSRSTEVQNELLALQPNFRGELVSNVRTFLEDCQHFYQDYAKVQEKEDRRGTSHEPE